MQGSVIITGAGSGIGLAAAEGFARHGYTVIASGRRLEKLEQAVAACEACGGSAVAVAGDVGEPATADALVSAALQHGPLVCLVNNAGVGWSYGIDHPGAMGAVQDTSYEQWREVQRINLDSVFLLCHAALPAMIEAGAGSIVNISSGGGLRGMDDAHSYATAKAGIINLTRSIARTYGPRGIRANVVAPGFVETDMVQPVLDSDMNPFADDATRFQVSPLGRPGSPAEIADAIYFMGITATYCNGAVLTVDGGSLA